MKKSLEIMLAVCALGHLAGSGWRNSWKAPASSK